MIKNLIFDLDGTLIDSLYDISRAISDALKQCGYSYSYDYESAKSLIGDGADTLIRRALKEKGNDEEAFAKLKSAYMPLYKAYQDENTAPFPGCVETLEKLARKGISLFVVTNKPDALAQLVIAKHFPKGLIKAVKGHVEGTPVKPDPYAVNQILSSFGLKKEETLYVGDSHVDIQTGHNAGLKTVLVTWGYDHYQEELTRKSEFIVASFSSLLNL